MGSTMFLDDEDMIVLTGKKIKSAQISALRKMGVAFRINAIGKAVVARSAIDGAKQVQEPSPEWTPGVLRR